MDTLKNNTINLFFLGLFVITLLALLSFQFRSEVLDDLEESNIAKIDMSDFVMYQIDANVTNVIIKGEHATQYKDHEIFTNVTLSRYLDSSTPKNLSTLSLTPKEKNPSTHFIETARGPSVKRVKNTYFFLSGIYYARSDGLEFFSQSGKLDTDKEVFEGEGDFSLKNAQGRVEGKDIVFYNSSQDVKAKDVRGFYTLEDKGAK